MRLFALSWDDKVIKIKFMGIRFRLKNHSDNHNRNIKQSNEMLDLLRQRMFYDELYTLFANNPLELPDFTKKKTAVISLLWENMQYVFRNWELVHYKELKKIPDFAIIWGAGSGEGNDKVVALTSQLNIPLLFIEDGFLKSADTWCNYKIDLKYRNGVSFTIDTKAPYFDATHASLLELMLNDKTLKITAEQKKRARQNINKIVANKLTKYNHQPIYTPEIGRKGVKKVLVVDQSYGDMSILRGRASDDTFEQMLQTAINENPDADIIVKTHPDTMTGVRGGYYSGLKEHDNIYLQTAPINPISLIQYVDKVYVCTTQFGFEALMCGKEVHVFGMPFYAGWGLTTDYQKCERRTNRRDLEELFYISYILYTHWVDPENRCGCEIETAIDRLLDLRKEYLHEQN